MSANNEPNGDLIANLIRLLGGAPKPLLLHCGGNSDRSELAAHMYWSSTVGRQADAVTQLSFSYGHFPWHWGGTGAIDRTFWRGCDSTLCGVWSGFGERGKRDYGDDETE